MKEAIQEFIATRRLAYLAADSVTRNGVFDFPSLVGVMERVYRVHAQGEYRMPRMDYLKYPGRPSYDRIIVLLGYLGGEFQVSGLKEICSSTSNKQLQLPRASGLILLNDPETQRPFAILEASQISAARTAAVTGLSVQLFAPRIIRKVGFLGCGYLARVHLDMWRQLYADRCSTIHVFDPNQEALESWTRHTREAGLVAVPCGSAREVVENADVLIPMTTQETPYIQAPWIHPGSLYSAVSLLDPELEVLRKASHIVVDDEALCKHEGRPLQVLEQEGGLKSKRLLTIGQVLQEGLEVRRSERETVFFNPMGTILTDLGAAFHVLGRALQGEDYVVLSA